METITNPTHFYDPLSTVLVVRVKDVVVYLKIIKFHVYLKD